MWGRALSASHACDTSFTVGCIKPLYPVLRSRLGDTLALPRKCVQLSSTKDLSDIAN